MSPQQQAQLGVEKVLWFAVWALDSRDVEFPPLEVTQGQQAVQEGKELGLVALVELGFPQQQARLEVWKLTFLG